VVLAVIVLFGVIVLRALGQGRDVKAGLKIPFAAFFLEVSDHDDSFSDTAKNSRTKAGLERKTQI
jgi:hypothetical protein